MAAHTSPARRSAPSREPAPPCAVAHLDPLRVARVRRRQIGAGAADVLAETFRLLGDPTRVRLLDALAVEELCVCELAALVGGSVSAVSHQLGSLRSLRLVRARREGRKVFYALDDAHILGLLKQGRRHVEEERLPARRAAGRGPQ